MHRIAHPFISRRAATALALTALASAGAHATLVTRGGGMVYDTDRNLTWMADASLLATMRGADPTLIASIVAQVPTVTAAGLTRNITAADFSTTTTGHLAGYATWWGATAFAQSLHYGGYSDWRLPVSLQPDAACSGQGANSNTSFGTGCTGSELGHLFYEELGGTANRDLINFHNGNYALFTGVEYDMWTATTDLGAPTTPSAWQFARNGVQLNFSTGAFDGSIASIWLVRDGDVTAAVPEPTSTALLLTGLVAVGASRIRRRAA